MGVSIYYLEKNNEIHYVGQTTSPKQRESSHKKKYPHSTLNVIDIVPLSEWVFWERYYVSLFRTWGFVLDNKNGGGGGLRFHTKETKKTISDGLIGNKIRLGKRHSQETKDKISKKKKGVSIINRKKVSKEGKLNMSLSQMGNKNALGHKLSDESKKKISINRSGIGHTEETKKRISERMKIVRSMYKGPDKFKHKQ